MSKPKWRELVENLNSSLKLQMILESERAGYKFIGPTVIEEFLKEYDLLHAEVQDLMPFDAYYLNWEVERGLMYVEIEKLQNAFKQLGNSKLEMEDRLIEERNELKLIAESFRAKFAEIVAIDAPYPTQHPGVSRLKHCVAIAREALEQK